MASQPEPFADRVKRLVANTEGMTVAKLGFVAYKPDVKGTNPDTFKSVMAGRRAVTPVLIEAVADVLDVEPNEFPEYRLARMRRALDEREVGLQSAVRMLDDVEDGLRRQGVEEFIEAAEEAARPPDTPSGRRGPAQGGEDDRTEER